MKTFFTLLLLTSFLAGSQLNAQQKVRTSHSGINRCGTEEAIELRYRTDTAFKAMMDKREKDYQEYMRLNAGRLNELTRTSTLSGTVTIPVVVHIVLPNPEIITDADVQYFIDRLNLDYSGLNPDSTNATSFYSVRGHSLLRFQLARRDPNGNYTTGIERKVGTAGILTGEPQPLKSTSTGGLNPWPFQQYYNLWVGADASGQGLLGISPEIGSGTAASDGICVSYQSFSNSGCGYTIPAFNMGRTAVHEIGHNFGLYHIFSGCTNGADFAQVTTASGCTLPANLLATSDDTPNQNTSTSGCLSGNVVSDCSGVANPPGKMYQNYMDYTDDACYSMFTKAQVERMHYVLEFCRGGGYLTTQGHLPPAGMPALDAAVMSIVNPGGSEIVNCASINYTTPVCPGSFQPKVRIENRGTTTLTAVTVSISINSSVVATQAFTGLSIATYKNTVLTFTSTQNLVSGANNIVYTVSAPNGSADAVAANNTGTVTVNISSATAAPFIQDFTGATFPPSNMTNNVSAKWIRSTSGNINAGSAFIDNYNNATVGDISELRTYPITIPGTITATDSVIITWDLAHKNYGTTFNDTLALLVSSNCGQTFTEVWKAWGATLATAGASTSGYTTPGAADWATRRVGIGGSLINQGPITVAFRNINRYGNNIFIDNVSIAKKVVLPLNIVSFNAYKQSEKAIKLDWKTTNEVNCRSFLLEKSVNGISFNNIQTVDAQNGFSNNYSIVDNMPFLGANYYRLQQIDKDGKISYSNIILVNTKNGNFNTVSLFPNPAKNNLTLNITSASTGMADVNITDPLGRSVLQNKIDLSMGNQSVLLNLQTLKSGIYYISVTWNNEMITQKLIKE
jgi:hypothetical protein